MLCRSASPTVFQHTPTVFQQEATATVPAMSPVQRTAAPEHHTAPASTAAPVSSQPTRSAPEQLTTAIPVAPVIPMPQTFSPTAQQHENRRESIHSHPVDTTTFDSTSTTVSRQCSASPDKLPGTDPERRLSQQMSQPLSQQPSQRLSQQQPDVQPLLVTQHQAERPVAFPDLEEPFDVSSSGDPSSRPMTADSAAPDRLLMQAMSQSAGRHARRSSVARSAEFAAQVRLLQHYLVCMRIPRCWWASRRMRACHAASAAFVTGSSESDSPSRGC